jgi:hypothetical protein
MTLDRKDVPMVDRPRGPALDWVPTTARLSFKIVWKSTGKAIENPAQRFGFPGTPASCRMEARMNVPSIGFSWKRRSAISRFWATK